MKASCVATTLSGARCSVRFGLCEVHHQCLHHDPCRAEDRDKRNRRAGLTTAAKLRMPGLDPAELPALDSPQVASRWLEVIARAVTTNRIGAKEATAAVQALQAWLKSHEAGAVQDQLAELRAKLETVRRPTVVK